MSNRTIFSIILTTTLSLSLQAQEENTHRTLTIEGLYQAQAEGSVKLMPEPSQKPVSNQSVSNVEYIFSASEYGQYSREPLQLFSSERGEERDPLSGLLRLSLGTGRNSDCLASLAWSPTKRDRVDLTGTLYGWNTTIGDWKSKYYTTDWKLSYSHSFEKSRLNGWVTYGLGRYNYRPTPVGVATDGIYMTGLDTYSSAAFSSTLPSAGSKVMGDHCYRVGADWSGTEETGLQWRVGMEWQGAENKLLREAYDSYGSILKSQNLLTVYGTLGFNHDNPGRVGMDYRQRVFFNNRSKWEDYSTITLSPYWLWSAGKFEAKAGANLDFRTTKHLGFLVSPSAKVEYKAASLLTLFVNATGGLQDCSLGKLRNISPYWSVGTYQLYDGYDLCDLSLGGELRLSGWLHASLSGGARYSRDELWQQPCMDLICVTTLLRPDNFKEYYAYLSAHAVCGTVADLNIQMRLSKWESKYFVESLCFKPRFSLHLNSHFNLSKRISAELDYRHITYSKYNYKRNNPVNDLSVMAEYELSHSLALYAALHNLLNRNYSCCAGYECQSINALLGVTCRF